MPRPLGWILRPHTPAKIPFSATFPGLLAYVNNRICLLRSPLRIWLECVELNP